MAALRGDAGRASRGARAAGLTPTDTTGLVYNPLWDEFSLSRDTDVNLFRRRDTPA